MSTIKNPPVPSEHPIPGGMTLGMMITVQGIVPQTSDRFAVNLLCSTGDIALHVSPRFRENYVARNNVQHMTWGKEEKTGGLPIYPGQSFEIIILCEENDFKIAFNGNHFAEFSHRVSFTKIASVEIEGDVIVNNIHFGGESENLTDTRNPSSASYGFQARSPSPYANSGDMSSGSGHIYPSVPIEPTAPSSGSFPVGPNPGGVPYSSGPSRPSPGPFPNTPSGPSRPSPGPFPNTPSGGLYPSPAPPPNYPPSPQPSYPSAPQPNYPPAGPYPSSGGFYPPPPQSGMYPNSGPKYQPQGPSLYPQQPGYGPDSNSASYPYVPNQDSHGFTPKPSSKSSFLDQAGSAIVGILGPALINKGIRKAQGTHTSGQNQGGKDILGQAAGALAGLLGGGGLLGSNRGRGVVPPHSQSSFNRPGGTLLDQAGQALAGIFGGRSGLTGNSMRGTQNYRN